MVFVELLVIIEDETYYVTAPLVSLFSRGIAMEKMDPFGEVSNFKSQLFFLINEETINKPRPVPPSEVRVVKKGVKILFSISLGIPGPVSCILSSRNLLFLYIE
jgi:hypothetical protein